MGSMFSTQLNVNVITSKQVQRTINKITINTVQSCISDTNAVQKIEINGNNNTISNLIATQLVNNNLSCLTSSDNQLAIVNALSAQLKNEVNTNASTMFGWALNANVIDQTTVQEAITEHMINVIQGCSQTFNLSQEVFVNGDYNTIVDTTLNQEGSQFAQCVFGSANMDSVSNKIAADINNRADTTTSTFSNMIGWLIIIAAAVGGGAVLIKVAGDARRKANTAQGLPPNYRGNGKLGQLPSKSTVQQKAAAATGKTQTIKRIQAKPVQAKPVQAKPVPTKPLPSVPVKV